jgi:hypothetical protein
LRARTSGVQFDTGLDIGMDVEPGTAMAQADSLLRSQIALLVVLLAATVVASLLGGEHFVRRPTATMADDARRLASGDLSPRAHLRRSAPGVDELAIAVNAMATEMEIRSRAESRAMRELRESEELAAPRAEARDRGPARCRRRAITSTTC